MRAIKAKPRHFNLRVAVVEVVRDGVSGLHGGEAIVHDFGSVEVGFDRIDHSLHCGLGFGDFFQTCNVSFGNRNSGDFQVGSGVASPKLDGLPGGTAPGQMMVEKNAGAARAVRDALEAVGGSGSPAGSAIWYVAGLGMSVRDWSIRLGWSGKAMSKEEGKGILIAALGMLARYYGYERDSHGRVRRRGLEFESQSSVPG